MPAKVRAALTSVALVTLLLGAPQAAANKPTEPGNSGVVERYEAIGGHQVGPVMTDVGGTALPSLVVVGWDDAVAFCTDGPPVFNGVEQHVVSPSGNLTIVVHNSDIPILVFDVSAAVSEQDFFDKCASGDIAPLATGTANQRPILHVTDRTFSVKVKTRGVVSDPTGQDWTMQSFLQVRELVGADEAAVPKEWVKLTAR